MHAREGKAAAASQLRGINDDCAAITMAQYTVDAVLPDHMYQLSKHVVGQFSSTKNRQDADCPEGGDTDVAVASAYMPSAAVGGLEFLRHKNSKAQKLRAQNPPRMAIALGGTDAAVSMPRKRAWRIPH